MTWTDLVNALGADRYMQHALCLTNDPVLMLLYVTGDAVTFISYFTIGACLLMTQRRAIQFRPGTQALYGAFIFLCGLSHLTETVTLFWGIYRLDVAVTAMMAAVSGITAYFTVLDTLASFDDAHERA